MEEEKTENANAFKITRKKKNDTFNKLLIKAKEDPIAQFELGVKYYNGDGVEQNYDEAFKWFTKSSENGNLQAQYNLAVMYENGEGTKENLDEAIKWYKKSSEQGNNDSIEALKELGIYEQDNEELVVFVDDEEEKQEEKKEEINEFYKTALQAYKNNDYKKAFEYFTKSAENGNSKAQYNLAAMYENGEGTKENLEEAKKWYKKSAEQGNNDSIEALKELDINEQDNEELVVFVDDEEEKNNSNELLELGNKYYNGIGVKQDYKKAFEHFKKCAENGNSQAQCNLAKMYEKGYGVKEDFEEAVKWYKKSAEKGNKYAKDSLKFYKFICPHCKSSDLRKSSEDEYKKEEKKNKKNAIQNFVIWLIVAIGISIYVINLTSGCGCSWVVLILLGLFIIIGVGVVISEGERKNLYTCNSCKHVIIEEDYKQLFDYFKESAEKGNSYAQYNIGAMYQQADGMKDEKNYDLEEAIKWYKKSARQGNKRAIETLNFKKKCPKCNSVDVKFDGYLYTCNYCEEKFTDENYKLALQKYASASEENKHKIEAYQESHIYLLKSAYDGNDRAQYFLGTMHLEGLTIFRQTDFSVQKVDIVKRDINQAENWFEISAEQGNEKSKVALKELEESELDEQKYEEIEKETMKQLQAEANAKGAVNLTLDIISKIFGG